MPNRVGAKMHPILNVEVKIVGTVELYRCICVPVESDNLGQQRS